MLGCNGGLSISTVNDGECPFLIWSLWWWMRVFFIRKQKVLTKKDPTGRIHVCQFAVGSNLTPSSCLPGLQLPVLGFQTAVVTPQLRVFVQQLLQLQLLPLLQRCHTLVVPPPSFHPGHWLLTLPCPHLRLSLQSCTPGLALAAACQHCCMLGALGYLLHLRVCVCINQRDHVCAYVLEIAVG